MQANSGANGNPFVQGKKLTNSGAKGIPFAQRKK
jgi:hypothetical protein